MQREREKLEGKELLEAAAKARLLKASESGEDVKEKDTPSKKRKKDGGGGVSNGGVLR